MAYWNAPDLKEKHTKTKQIIAVVGGTGAQGGGVVGALLEGGRFAVRVLTRNAIGEQESIV